MSCHVETLSMMQAHHLSSRLAAVTAAQPEATLQARSHLVTALFYDVNATASAELSSLFDLCEALVAAGSTQDISEAVTAAAAALVFLSRGKASSSVLRQFVQQVFLPLAAATAGTPASSQLLHQLACLLSQHQAWEVMLEMLQCAQDALAAGLDATSRSIHGSTVNVTQGLQQQTCSTGSSLERWQITFQLPPTTACVAVEELAEAAVAEQQQQQQQGHVTDSAVACILQLLAGPLFATACSLLACSNAPLRQAAFQQLLPALLAAAAAASNASEQQCMQQLWKQCLSMISEPALPRRMGLAVLLQYHSSWGLHPPAAAAAADSADAAMPARPQPSAAAITSSDGSEQFWSLLRACLVDGEALNRKRAFRLLQLLLPEQQLAAQPVWVVFLALYELLDEFSPHLVKAAWPQVGQSCMLAPHLCCMNRPLWQALLLAAPDALYNLLLT
jgi:hypothetical protein